MWIRLKNIINTVLYFSAICIFAVILGTGAVEVLNYFLYTIHASRYDHYVDDHPGPWIKAKQFVFVGKKITVKQEMDFLGNKLPKAKDCDVMLSFVGYEKVGNYILFCRGFQQEDGVFWMNYPPVKATLPYNHPPHGDADLGEFGKIHVIWAGEDGLVYEFQK